MWVHRNEAATITENQGHGSWTIGVIFLMWYKWGGRLWLGNLMESGLCLSHFLVPRWLLQLQTSRLRSRQEVGEVDTAPPEDICPQLSWAWSCVCVTSLTYKKAWGKEESLTFPASRWKWAKVISCGGFSTEPVTVIHLSTRRVPRGIMGCSGMGRPDHVYSKFPTCEQAPFQECVCKSNFFISSTNIT